MTKKLFITAIALLLLLTGCTSTQAPNDPSAELPTPTELDFWKEGTSYISHTAEQKLLKDYAAYLNELSDGTNESPEKFYVESVLAEYGGCLIVKMGRSDGILQAYPGTNLSASIADYTIRYIEGVPLYAYKTGTFYLLAEAYEQGLLTKRNIYDIGTMVDPTFKERYPAFEE